MRNRLLLLLFLSSGFAFGQITLQYADYQRAFSVGTTFVTYSTPIGGPDVEVFIGRASSTAQTWDLTALPMEYAGNSVSIEPSAAPLINDFPGTNIVLYEKYLLGLADTIYTWNYKILTNDELLLLGDSDETSVIWSWDPPAVQAKIPLTLGTNWIQSRDSTYIMPEMYTISENVVTIDAFGTLKVTSGEFPCLRMRHDNRTIVHSPAGTDTSGTRSFNFYTEGMIEVHVGTITQDQFDLETVWVSGVKISGRQGLVGLPSADLQGKARFLSVYPNPVCERAEIQYCLTQNSNVQIVLTDLAGRQISTILNEYQSVGEHRTKIDATALPAGIYLIRLESKGEYITEKVVVSR